jgi:tetratricopeptide (TPR) repeat protein
VLEITTASVNTLLPYKVYNNEQVFFPPIFLQEGSSCVHAAEIGYNFTYEINRARNVAAGNWNSNKENCYYPLFTYNFVNDGSGATYTDYTGGFQIIKENGCPMYSVYDDPALNTANKFKYWMTDFNNYYSGMSNKISEYQLIPFSTTYSSLNDLKHWLADHGEGAETGGLAVIAVLTDGWNPYSTIPMASPEEHGKKLITQWGTSNGHALTIVGYNDEIWCFDMNNDGDYTIDEDVDLDGDVDLFDCEKGAFKIANSSGAGFGNDGFIFVPYKLMAAGLQWADTSYICKSQGVYEPSITIKTSITHPSRNKLKCKLGYGNLASDVIPIASTEMNSFKNQGGANEMRGAYSGPIEIGLNFGYFYGNKDFGKIYFIVNSIEPGNSFSDTIKQFSIIDHRWGVDFELDCGLTNVPINNGDNILSIEYDLIPHEQPIDTNLTFNSNMVSRFSPRVSNHKTLTVNERVKIDMYKSELIIDEFSTLVIKNGSEFRAKRGLSKITINGNIQLDKDVTFSADFGDTLEIYFNNINQVINIDSCHFQNCIIKSKSPLELSNCDFGGSKVYSKNELSISGSEFTNSFVDQIIDDISITASTFTHSSVIASNPAMWTAVIDNSATITNNKFTSAYNGANSIIEIYGYKNYTIANDTINTFGSLTSASHAIAVHYSGASTAKNMHTISNNTIYCEGGNCNTEMTGITVYSSIADILDNNYIHDNYIGVQSLGTSLVNIIGNQAAGNEGATQRIKNNEHFQISASVNAYPILINWNAIYDSINPDGCFVYFDMNSLNTDSVDIRNNYWGETFNPRTNLCPKLHYNYLPVWEFLGGQLGLSSAQLLYATGQTQVADSNYTAAKTTFQQLVTTYPNEEPATHALKEILYLEPLAGNDFTGLKNWYLTQPEILNHDQLVKLANNLANKCNEKLESYQEAIAWYENVIQNPEILEDSIFAIIDLEHLYWQMGIDTTLRSSSYVGSMPQYKPKSFQSFKNEKDELLRLLFGGHKQSVEPKMTFDDKRTLKQGYLLQNMPNPFSGKTTIQFNLTTNEAVPIAIKIFDRLGKMVKQIDIQQAKAGLNAIDIDMQTLLTGMYYYSLFINGQQTDSKKMVVVI